MVKTISPSSVVRHSVLRCYRNITCYVMGIETDSHSLSSS